MPNTPGESWPHLKDAYGRDKVPEEPKLPKHFDPMRPFRWLAFAFLWYCWRATSLDIRKWDGTRDKEFLTKEVSHDGPTWGIWLILVIIVMIFCFMSAPFKQPLIGGIALLLFVINVIMMIVVKGMFGLHDLEARLHWKEKLLK